MKDKKMLIGVLSITMLLSGLTLTACDKDNTENKEAQTYQITYVLDGGTNSNQNPSSYKSDSDEITLSAATKDGYTFDGWYTTSTFSSTSKVEKIEKNSSGNKTLYAKFTPIEYTITYHLNGASKPVTNPDTYNVENSEIILAAAVLSNHHFEGWYTTATFDANTKITSIPAGSKQNYELYAKLQTLTLNSETTIEERAEAEVEKLKDNVYNLANDHEGAVTNYTVEEINTKATTASKQEIDFYVEVGDLTNIDEVTSVGFGDIVFANDEDVALSIGNNNFIKDKAFVVRNNKLYVAATILAYEGSNKNKIIVNDYQYNFAYKENDTSRDDLVFDNFATQIESSTGGITIEQSSVGNYTIKFTRSANTNQRFVFSYSDAVAGEAMISRKVDSDEVVSYGFTLAETVNDKTGYTMTFWGADLSNDDVARSLNGRVINVELYIKGKGVIRITITLEVEGLDAA